MTGSVTWLSYGHAHAVGGYPSSWALIFLALCSGVIGLIPVGPFHASSSHAAIMTEDTVQTLMLKDVQALHGGQNVYLRADGQGFCQVVVWDIQASSLYERRYRIKVSDDGMQRLTKLMRNPSFSPPSSPTRPGVPDEAKPAISVVFVSGKTIQVSKWANDTYPAFDQVYEMLLAEVRTARQMTPVHEGTFDSRWAPAGFASQ